MKKTSTKQNPGIDQRESAAAGGADFSANPGVPAPNDAEEEKALVRPVVVERYSAERGDDGPPAGKCRIVLNLCWRTLKHRDICELIGELRHPNDPEARKELLSGNFSISPSEFSALMYVDKLQETIDYLDRMEKHYSEVATLDANETQRRLARAAADDLGALAYRRCLVDKADPRLKIAKRLLDLIPIARRHLLAGKPALDLVEIFRLNERANYLLRASSPSARLEDPGGGARRRTPEKVRRKKRSD